MRENHIIPEAKEGRFKSPITLHTGFQGSREIPIDDALEAADQSLFYVQSIITLIMMLDPYRIGVLGAEEMRSQLITLGELCLSLMGAASGLLETINDERERLAAKVSESQPPLIVIPFGKRIDQIVNIILKTRAHKGDAAEIEDDQAVMMISDLLLTKGAHNE